jgi:hypothetical protein
MTYVRALCLFAALAMSSAKAAPTTEQEMRAVTQAIQEVRDGDPQVHVTRIP